MMAINKYTAPSKIENEYLIFLLSDEKTGWKSFYAVQEERQEQAERSVLFNCPPKTSERKILKYLSRHGEIKKYFSYESYVSERLLSTSVAHWCVSC